MEWVGIVGSRDFVHPHWVASYIATLAPDTVIVSGHGGCVDLEAEGAARKRGLATCIFPAQWDRYGNAAGPIRNGHIITTLASHQGRLVAFHDGTSRGTADTIRKARAAGLAVLVIYQNGEMAT